MNNCPVVRVKETTARPFSALDLVKGQGSLLDSPLSCWFFLSRNIPRFFNATACSVFIEGQGQAFVCALIVINRIYMVLWVLTSRMYYKILPLVEFIFNAMTFLVHRT